MIFLKFIDPSLDLQNEVEQLNEKNVALTLNNTALKSEKVELGKKISQLELEKSEQSTKIQQLQNQVSVPPNFDPNVLNLKEEAIRNLQTENNTLKITLQTAKVETTTLRTENANLTAQIQQLKEPSTASSGDDQLIKCEQEILSLKNEIQVKDKAILKIYESFTHFEAILKISENKSNFELSERTLELENKLKDSELELQNLKLENATQKDLIFKFQTSDQVKSQVDEILDKFFNWIKFWNPNPPDVQEPYLTHFNNVKDSLKDFYDDKKFSVSQAEAFKQEWAIKEKDFNEKLEILAQERDRMEKEIDEKKEKLIQECDKKEKEISEKMKQMESIRVLLVQKGNDLEEKAEKMESNWQFKAEKEKVVNETMKRMETILKDLDKISQEVIEDSDAFVEIMKIFDLIFKLMTTTDQNLKTEAKEELLESRKYLEMEMSKIEERKKDSKDLSDEEPIKDQDQAFQLYEKLQKNSKKMHLSPELIQSLDSYCAKLLDSQIGKSDQE